MASEILNVFKLRIMPGKLKNYDSIKSIEKRTKYSNLMVLKTLSDLGPKMWDLVPNEIKQLASVKSIKLKTKK